MTRPKEATTDSHPGSRRAGLSVRIRIAVAVAVLTGLALAGAGFVVHALESRTIEQSVSAQIDQELAEFEELSRGDDPETGREFTRVSRLIALFLLRNVPDDDEVLLGFQETDLRWRSKKLDRRDLSAEPRIMAAITARLDDGGSARIEDTPWGDVLLTVQPARINETSGALVVVKFIQFEHRELDRVMQTYAIVALLSLGLITAIAAWQAGRLLRPLRALRETAQDISETDLSRRLPVRGRDDISALTQTFNEMLVRLDDAFTGQRRFLDAAGHELKTPLTVIRGHMEVVDAGDPADVKATQDLLLDEIDRMSRLVNDLIMLTKAHRPDFVRLQPVDIRSLTETVLDKCRALGERKWRLDEAAPVTADIDQQRITQALLELAQNAVKHTRSGELIAVGSALKPGVGLKLWVRDAGRGVLEEHREVIFERFGRGVVPMGDEGFGLGLSIVRAITEAHGGNLTLEDAEPRGAWFVITLPEHRVLSGEEDAWLES